MVGVAAFFGFILTFLVGLLFFVFVVGIYGNARRTRIATERILDLLAHQGSRQTAGEKVLPSPAGALEIEPQESLPREVRIGIVVAFVMIIIVFVLYSVSR